MKIGFVVGYSIVASSFVLLAGCSLRVPTPAEQAKLADDGAFPGGTPAWVSAAVAGPSADAGSIPQHFKAPKATEAAQLSYENEGERIVAEKVTAKPAAPTTNNSEAEAADSPLNRITRSCPSVEADVRQALITPELDQRTKMYAGLVKRCPSSADLWLWLGKDYLAADDLDNATRSFEKVLTYDHDNAEAKSLLSNIGKRQQSATTKK